MKIDKDQIMQLLRADDEPGDKDKADQAQQELPDQVDTDDPQHQSMLQKFGIDPSQLLTRFGSGGLNF